MDESLIEKQNGNFANTLLGAVLLTNSNKMKYYFIKSINLPFYREWEIYNDWVCTEKNLLIEKVREDLEVNVLFEQTTLTESDGWLLVNKSKDKWLKICEVELIS